MNSRDLPVYQQRERILNALESHRVVVVESPTGSGKTTQLPVILHEAGYSDKGVIGVTQPRRIAAVSVSSFVARQLGGEIPGLVGYKMRFYDKTTPETRIKVMTDGILLQEIKNDQNLQDYSIIIVDEAHERNLNIDFVLGLLKRAMELRDDLRVIVSSATINADIFSQYFDSCPVVRIETPMYPVQIIYDDPRVTSIQQRAANEASRAGRRFNRRAERELAYDARIDRVVTIVKRLMEEKAEGDILVFLSGEQMIKDAMTRLHGLPAREKLYILPLYGRLSKEEQDAVFPPPPEGKTKIVLATNIAETSITIDGIMIVIDSGLAKTNFYNPRTYTSALIEGPISKASANQRRGRAGRTRPGRCYRLYSKRDFEERSLFQDDEIYRTDLSEVVLRMAELGIRDFEDFDFISSPGVENILGAIETLRLLDALDKDRNLTEVGRRMAIFPLLPRHSRIIIEAIQRYPDVLNEVIIAVAFLTSPTPFILPPGEETEARRAHHQYRNDLGDFVSYLRLFAAYTDTTDTKRYCESRYLDPRTMAEIHNVKDQLAEIVSDMGIPLLTGGSRTDYLTAIGRGLIQFVCIHSGKGVYQSLTAERIQIHPGSGMFRETPRFIVAGEIVRTSRTWARSVSPLEKVALKAISEDLYAQLRETQGRGGERDRDRAAAPQDKGRRETTWQIQIGGSAFNLVPYKGKKKIAVLPWKELSRLYMKGRRPTVQGNAAKVRARVEIGENVLLNGERLSVVLRIGRYIPKEPRIRSDRGGKLTFALPSQIGDLIAEIPSILDLAPVKKNAKNLGFLALYSHKDGRYWFKPNRSFFNAVQESVASLEQLVDELDATVKDGCSTVVGAAYRKLIDTMENDE